MLDLLLKGVRNHKKMVINGQRKPNQTAKIKIVFLSDENFGFDLAINTNFTA